MSQIRNRRIAECGFRIAETGVVVLNDDMISAFFESRPTVLSDEQITNICSHLDQTARS
jgi:hypothetical protein